jgi:hypothetical protein
MLSARSQRDRICWGLAIISSNSLSSAWRKYLEVLDEDLDEAVQLWCFETKADSS